MLWRMVLACSIGRLAVNDSQKAKEHCEKALTINRECGNREFEARLYLSLGELFQSFGECGKAADYLQKACFISSQIGDKMTEFQSLLQAYNVKDIAVGGCGGNEIASSVYWKI